VKKFSIYEGSSSPNLPNITNQEKVGFLVFCLIFSKILLNFEVFVLRLKYIPFPRSFRERKDLDMKEPV